MDTIKGYDPIEEYDELTKRTVRIIRESFTGMQGLILRLGDIDLARGSGRIDEHTRCVWTKEGHRITMSQGPEGTRTCAYSNWRDPLADPGARPRIENVPQDTEMNPQKVHN